MKRLLFNITFISLCFSVHSEELVFVHEPDGSAQLVNKLSSEPTGTYIQFKSIQIDDQTIELETPIISKTKYTLSKQWQSGIKETWFNSEHQYQVTLTINPHLIKPGAKEITINYDIDSDDSNSMIYVGEYAKYPIKNRQDSEAIVFNSSPLMLDKRCQSESSSQNRKGKQHQFLANIPDGNEPITLAMTFHVNDNLSYSKRFNPVDLIITDHNIVISRYNHPLEAYKLIDKQYQISQQLNQLDEDNKNIENAAFDTNLLVIPKSLYPDTKLLVNVVKNNQWQYDSVIGPKTFGEYFFVDNGRIYASYLDNSKAAIVAYEKQGNRWQENKILDFPFDDYHAFIEDFKKEDDFLAVALSQRGYQVGIPSVILIYRYHKSWQLEDTIQLGDEFNFGVESMAFKNGILAVNAYPLKQVKPLENEDFVLLFKQIKKWQHITTLEPDLLAQNSSLTIQYFSLNFGDKVLIADDKIYIFSGQQQVQSSALKSDIDNCYLSDSWGAIYVYKHSKDTWDLEEIIKAEQLGFSISTPTLSNDDLYYIENNGQEAYLKQVRYTPNKTTTSVPIDLTDN